ncbi:hypothetical protein [Bradyrhizobium sp. Tv2a-2]|uniref:hypothetical protein n=1 Tax=Bradyrhizobium sp. Tv2a-2 TaxID=113395 RepID=UPI0003F8D4ED|nr:hypothetical protein [Bradyrhizobium sp. Tv2a-2]
MLKHAEEERQISMVERMPMSNPNWFSWYSFPFFAPLSGAVTQDIETNVLKISETQKKVFEKYSLFQQLETLFAAVTELKRPRGISTEAQSTGTQSTGEAMKRLEEMIKGVEEIKQRHGVAVRGDAERALSRLKAVNPAQYEAFMRDHATTRGNSGGDAGQTKD